MNPMYSPAPEGCGFDLFEHWEHPEHGEPRLLLVSSSPAAMRLEPGDVIYRRTWAPAGIPETYNSAARRSLAERAYGIEAQQ